MHSQDVWGKEALEVMGKEAKKIWDKVAQDALVSKVRRLEGKRAQ